ncbi:membrane-associated phospholipid phosphatase [Janthinobacterium sp. CG_23.3]
MMAPAGIAIAVWLAGGNSWRLALQWCLLFGAGMALVVASKVAFIGWGIGISAIEFAGFSGHAMRAGAVLPVALFVILSGAAPVPRYAGAAVGVLLAVLVSISRVQVHAHSASESITGTVLGLLVAALFIRQAGATREPVVSRLLVALSMCALLWTPNVEPLPTEQWMTRLALHLSGHERPFERSHWKLAQRHPLLR